MKKDSSQSGLFQARVVVALALCSIGLVLASASFAAAGKLKRQPVRPVAAAPTPSASGTISRANPTLTYSDGPFVVPNKSGTATSPVCSAPMLCSDSALTVDMSGGADPDPTKQVRISVSWPVVAADFDLYVYAGSPATTVLTTRATSSGDPEVVTLQAISAVYTIRVVPVNPAGQSYTATVTLEDAPPPIVNTAPPPRYQNYPPNPRNLPGSGSAGEPSIGVDWNPNVPSLRQITPQTPGSPPVNGVSLNTGGVAFFTADLNEYRVNFDDCSSPAKNAWKDVTNPTENINTLDPIGFVDHQYPGEPGTGYPSPSGQLGRVFQSQLAGATSIASYSSDDGNSWTQSQGSGQPAGVDHQTFGGGPYAHTSVGPPPVVEPPHLLYPHQIYYASQDVGTAFAARSDDGGRTFNAGVPMWNISQCGGLHGHIKVGQDGTAYVPNRNCGGNTGVAVSRNNGLTWTVKTVHDGAYVAGRGDTDPSVGIGADNTLYLGYQNNDGHPHIAVSSDHGDTWHDVDVGQGLIQHCVFAEVVAGDGDRAAFGFLGTSGSGGYQGTNTFTGVWYFYIATTFDRGQHYTLVDATNGDPVQVGSICTAGTTCGPDRNLLDFNDLQIDAEGRVLAAFADGCVAPICTAASAAAHNPPYTESRSALATVIRQSGGPRLLSAFDTQANCSGSGSMLACTPTLPSAPRVESVIGGNAVYVTWSAPDNGGSPITGYNIYRRTAAGIYGPPVATVTAGCPACKTTYEDTTADLTVAYFYKVSALNAQGESPTCDEFPVTAPGPVETPCLPPGITELTDPSGDNHAVLGIVGPAPPGTDLHSLQIAQPYQAAGPIKLMFTINTDPGQSPQASGSAWYVAMSITHGSTSSVKGVRMAWKATSPMTPVFESYTPTTNTSGGTDGRFVTAGSEMPADPTSSYLPPFDKVIIVVNASDLGLSAGDTLNGFIVGVEQSTSANDPGSTGAAELMDQMPDSLNFGGAGYTVRANALCAPNTAPIAALIANPLMGDPPLLVNFDASGSSDPDAGDTIASYTFTFGDGSPPATCPGDANCTGTGRISHTYQSNGHFKATVSVQDNHGLVSSNVASVEIEVDLPLNRVVSEKTHGSAGTFDVILFDPTVYPNGDGEVECRTEGNGYTIIYTFGPEYTVTGQASSAPTVTNGAAIGSHGPGPAANQYQVTLTGVQNAQFHFITLSGVPVHNSTTGSPNGGNATLNNAGVQLALLVGDVNGTRLVDGNDVSAVQAQTRQSLPTANFRLDVNCTGLIDGNDVSITQGQTRNSLPAGNSFRASGKINSPR